MGCWNGTDFITQLPIRHGERVKLFFVEVHSLSGLGGAGYCYSDGIATPVLLPITGKYNDYGTIENIEDSYNNAIVMKFFKDSSIGLKVSKDKHETYNKNYDLEQMIRWIERGRVTVNRLWPRPIEPKPGSKNKKLGIFDWTEVREKENNFGFVMVLERLYYAIVKEMANKKSWAGKITIKARLMKDHREAVKKYRDTKKKLGSIATLLIQRDSLLRRSISNGGSIYFYKLYDEFLLGTPKAKRTGIEVSPRALERDFINTVLFGSFMGYTRKAWIPQQGAGSQICGYKEHQMLAEWVANRCKKAGKYYD